MVSHVAQGTAPIHGSSVSRLAEVREQVVQAHMQSYRGKIGPLWSSYVRGTVGRSAPSKGRCHIFGRVVLFPGHISM